ncbi:MAG: hypothetical protein LUH58_04110 [Lachnospiraceae bacterium]|nr:hypothetical protein [Lachnospiraceae bacterium]
MHHKKIRLLFGLAITSTVILAVSGCAQTSSSAENQTESETVSTSAENTFVYTDDTDEELVSTTLTGTVESIDGNEITLTSENGGIFYTTNTESEIYISGVEITASDDCKFFLMCTGNDNERGWGTTGANGSQCSFTASDQEMKGDVIWDNISTLDFYMMDGSTLTGAVINDETHAGNGGDGYCSLYLSADSPWVVTGDSIVTNLYTEGTITDEAGNSVTIVGTDGTVYVQGTGSYTITVETYSTTADFSGASQAASWTDYEAEKPEA